MSAQRKTRTPNSGTRNQPPVESTQKSDRSGQRSPESDSDWAEMQAELGGQPAHRIGSPTAAARGTDNSNPMPRSNDQGGSHWNQRQDPEHPERPADGGAAEMRGSNEQASDHPDSPERPESGARERQPARRRSES